VDIQQKIEADLKAAMLAGDKNKVETLKMVKTAVQYEAVASEYKDKGLDNDQVQAVLARESKKRGEAADLYDKAGEAERSAAEKAEKAIIDEYLPAQVDEGEVAKAVDEEFAKLDSPTAADTGKVIAAVRGRLGTGVDGGVIARLVKEKL
jgi:uncharacterized protein